MIYGKDVCWFNQIQNNYSIPHDLAHWHKKNNVNLSVSKSQMKMKGRVTKCKAVKLLSCGELKTESE